MKKVDQVVLMLKDNVLYLKIRASPAAIEDLSNDKYDIKRHGKIEYIADIDRSLILNIITSVMTV